MSSVRDETTVPSYYYYVDPGSAPYEPQRPNPLDDLISVYGLQELSRQVARTNPDGTKAVKLRKSYKNQIQDLSGKFSVIPSRENGRGGEITSIVFQHNPDMMPQVRSKIDSNGKPINAEEWRRMIMNRDQTLFDPPLLDWDICSGVISQFERSYPGEFKSQGFEVEDLAFDLDGTGSSNGNISNAGAGSAAGGAGGAAGSGVGGTKGKKRKNKSNGSSMATPNSDMQEDIKRRRLE